MKEASWCPLCEREHGPECPTAARIQQSERHAEEEADHGNS